MSGAHSRSSGRRRSGAHRVGPAPISAAPTPRRGRHAGPLAPQVPSAEPAAVEPALAVAAPEQVELSGPRELSAPAPARSRHRRIQVESMARALRLTFLSAVIPGVGHLAAGRSRTGLVMAGSFATLLVGALLFVTTVPRTRIVRIAVEPGSLEFLMILSVAMALIWMLVVLSTWVVTKPTKLRTSERVVAGAFVAALSLGVATPFGVAAHTAFVQRDLIETVFAEAPPTVVAVGPRASRAGQVGESAAKGYFADQERVNLLLLGGDGGFNRTGVRTDSMILASIDTRTGRTVLISLPRNLERAQFPPDTPMGRQFPNGFDDLLNSAYTYAEAHPELMPGARHPGGELIKATFAYTIGQPVDYFVLINLAGFKDIVDAFGGVTMNVTTRLPIGGRHDANGNPTTPPTGYIEPGRQQLDGYEALWYGRSRYDSDDYTRMNRQRCLLGAIAKQASPLKVLTRFGKLAGAAKQIILTDIPRDALADLLQLAQKAKSAKVTSVTFVRSAAFDPANPQFSYIQTTVAAALAEATATATTPATTATATAGKSGRSGKSGTKKSASTAVPAPTADRLEAVCDY